MPCSHPERIAGLSQQIAAGAALLEEESAAARRAVAAVTSAWHGSAASAFEKTGAHLATQLARDASVLNDISAALLEMAATLEGAHDLWHQAEAAQSATVASTPLGMPVDSAQAHALAAQAHDQVTLAVQRAVLAFTVIAPQSWYFAGGALGGLVQNLERELIEQWRSARSDSLVVAGDPSVTLGMVMARLKVRVDEPPTPGDVQEFEQQRFDDLSRDPDHNGQINDKSREEARAALRLERRGLLRRVVRAPRNGADYVEDGGRGPTWDVKSFDDRHTGKRGDYDLRETIDSLEKTLDRDRDNVIINTAHLNSQHMAEIEQAVNAHPEWTGRVLYQDAASAPDPAAQSAPVSP